MKNLFSKIKMKNDLKDLEKVAQSNGWKTVVERRPLTAEEIETTFVDYIDEYGFLRSASLAEIGEKTDKFETHSYEW